MTRAEDRLILCGYRGERESENTWLQLAADGLGEEAVAFDHPIEGVSARRYQKTVLGAIEYKSQADRSVDPYPPLPEAYRQVLAPEPGLPRPLTPSGASALIEADTELSLRSGSPVLENVDIGSDAGRHFGLRRGIVMHTLLQRLPDIAADEREPMAHRYLEIAAAQWTEAQREQALTSVMAVFDDPQFAPVFSHHSKAEVSLMGKLELRGKMQAVSGQIDRLCVEDDRVLIVDYKTNRPPARNVEEVPPAYITQLALYRALVAPLYPHKRVEAALLFSEGPYLITLPDAVMEQALIALGKQAENTLDEIDIDLLSQ